QEGRLADLESGFPLEEGKAARDMALFQVHGRVVRQVSDHNERDGNGRGLIRYPSHFSFIPLPSIPLVTTMQARKLTRQDLREAAEKFKTGGRWGPHAEIGTLNFTQPEDIVAAARLVRKGKVISLALNFDQHGPQGAKSTYPAMGRINPVHTMLRTGTDAYSGVLDHRGSRRAAHMVVRPLPCGPRWEGLGHVFYENNMWNGYDCREVTTAGAQKCGIEKTKNRMVGRGVFLDVPRALGMDVLPDGHAITTAELDLTAK